MRVEQLEKELLRHTKGLPKDVLQEIIDFIQFLRQKKMIDKNNIMVKRTQLSASQTAHLEEEFKDYKQIYPHE